MALTWQNVAAPDFSGSIQAQRVAGENMNNGFGALSAALAGFDQQNMAKAKMADEQRRALLDDQTIRATNTGLGIKNSAGQFELDATKRDDALAQSRLAAQPEAAKLMAEIHLMANSGDPKQIEEAAARVAGNTAMWDRIGKTADQVTGMIDAQRTAGKAAFAYKHEVWDNEKLWEKKGISQEAQTIAFDAINNLPTPAMAKQSIQENREIKDPRIIAQAIKMIEEADAGKVFASTPADEQYLNALKGENPTVPEAQPAANQIDNTSSSLDVAKSLLRKEEGFLDAPRWDSNAFRAGYGSDTTTLADGRVVPIAEGMQVSTEDAERDLNYRLTSREGKKAREQIGAAWDTLPANIQAPLYSVAYNYGSLPKSVVAAVNSGDAGKIADAVRSLEANPDRRNREADMILGGEVPNLSGPRVNNQADALLSGAVDNFPQVSQNTTASTQEFQRRQRLQAINSSIADMTSSLDGGAITANSAIVEGAKSMWDYYTATPKEGEDRATTRQKHRETAKFISDNADYLRENPSEISIAQKDPVAFMENFGSNPNQKKWMDAKAANTLAASVNSTDAEKTSANTDEQGRRAPTVEDTKNDVQNLLDQSMMDRTRQPNAALLKHVADSANSEEFAPEVAKRLTGPEGPIPSGNTSAVLAAITETIKLSNGSLSPAAAGAIVADSMESTDVTPGWNWRPTQLFSDPADQWLTDKESPKAALRANMEKVQQTLKDLGQNVDGSIDTSKAVAQYSNKRASNVAASELPKVQKFLLEAAAEAGSLRAAIADGRDTPQIRAALKNAEAKIRRFQQLIDSADSSLVPATSIYTDAAQGLPVK